MSASSTAEQMPVASAEQDRAREGCGYDRERSRNVDMASARSGNDQAPVNDCGTLAPVSNSHNKCRPQMILIMLPEKGWPFRR